MKQKIHDKDLRFNQLNIEIELLKKENKRFETNENDFKNGITTREQTINSLIDQIKQFQNQESELNDVDSKKRKEMNKLHDKIKSLENEVSCEKKERQVVNVKYSKDAEKHNQVITKLQDKLKLVSSIDDMVADLRSQVDKYSKKGEKKDAKIAQLNQEILNYKNT